MSVGRDNRKKGDRRIIFTDRCFINSFALSGEVIVARIKI